MMLEAQSLMYLPPALEIVFAVAFFVLGACIGSFLNVVIYRLPLMLERQWLHEANNMLGQDVVADQQVFNLAFPGSACPHCHASIRFWQNIPVLSFLLLRGKCYACKAAISIRYPVVELITGLISVGIFFMYGLTIEAAALLLLIYVCIAMFGIDADHHLLPDCLTLPLIWAGLLLNAQSVFVSLEQSLYGAVIGYGVLWAVFWIFKMITGKEGMGYGDFKLLAAFGAWFGWMILPNTILLSSLLGSVIGGLMLWKNGNDSQTPIAFGPFIIFAGLLTALFPQYFTLMSYLR